jgi:hypothetical protein
MLPLNGMAERAVLTVVLLEPVNARLPGVYHRLLTPCHEASFARSSNQRGSRIIK